MFGKSKAPPGNPGLADRVRQVTHRDVQPNSEPAVTRRVSIGPSKQRPPREPVYRSAVLVLSDGQRLRVAIKDLSANGARVEYFVRTELPEQVLLAEPTLKLRRYARVAWQGDGVAGLQFLPE